MVWSNSLDQVVSVRVFPGGFATKSTNNIAVFDSSLFHRDIQVIPRGADVLGLARLYGTHISSHQPSNKHLRYTKHKRSHLYMQQ